MGKDVLLQLMKNTATMESGKMIKNMDLVKNLLKENTNIKVNFKMDSLMEMDY